MQWLSAPGLAVNAPPPASPEDRLPLHAAPSAQRSEDLDAAMQRVQELQKRIQELEAQTQSHFERGRQTGNAEGRKAGAEAAAREWQPHIERLSRSIAELATYRAQFRRDSEPELLRLAMAVARKILHRELSVDPHSLLGVVKAALESINQAEILTVRVSDADANALAGILSGIGLPAEVELTPDRTLERGSIVISTRRGNVDAGIQTQLAEIEHGFADRIASGRKS